MKGDWRREGMRREHLYNSEKIPQEKPCFSTPRNFSPPLKVAITHFGAF